MDKELLRYAGLTGEQIQQYEALETALGEKIYPLAEQYFQGEYQHISQLYDPICSQVQSEAELFGAMLLVVMRCAQLRADTLTGRQKELFLDSLTDISFKLRECQAYRKHFGIFVMNWYDGLIKGCRLSLGRLQFDAGVYQGETVTVGDFVLRQEEPKLQCHIPSAGPLTYEDCMASLKRAWEEFPRYRKGEVLPVLCDSWLLYPPYEQVFGEGSGVGMFRKLWHIYGQAQQSRFEDCWRIFSMDPPEDLSLLPQNTRMQRAFARYMAAGGSYGTGKGILLFDGNQIVIPAVKNQIG